MPIEKLKQTWKESPEAIIGLGFWIIFLSVIFGAGILSRPGPDPGTPTCVVDNETIRYTTDMDVSAEHYTVKINLTTKVGDHGTWCERLESLTPLSNDSWQATYRNIITGKTATETLYQCHGQ